MENENKNTIIPDEELKNIIGGEKSPMMLYCEGHTTEEACVSSGRCRWYPSSSWTDPVTGEFTGGFCFPNGK